MNELLIFLIIMTGVCLFFTALILYDKLYWGYQFLDDIELVDLSNDIFYWKCETEGFDKWGFTNHYKEYVRKKEKIKAQELLVKITITFDDIRKLANQIRSVQPKFDTLYYNVEGVDEFMYQLQGLGFNTIYSNLIPKGTIYGAKTKDLYLPKYLNYKE